MENKIYGRIYLITNLINNKQYIGQTIQPIQKRFKEHIRKSKYSQNIKMAIIKAIKKYDKENFKIEEIDIAYSKKELDLLEGVYISWFNTLAPNGYNIKNIINGREKFSKTSIEKMKTSANKPERLKQLSENGKKARGRTKSGSKSKYIGVHIMCNKYVGSIGFNSKRIHLGYYNIETDAAKAYDIKALELFGYDCVLNFPDLKQDYINNKVIVKRNIRKNRL